MTYKSDTFLIAKLLEVFFFFLISFITKGLGIIILLLYHGKSIFILQVAQISYDRSGTYSFHGQG